MFHPLIKSIGLVLLVYIVYEGLMYYTPLGPILREFLPYEFFFDFAFVVPPFIGIAYARWSYQHRRAEWD